MSESILIQYQGFESKTLVREYRFQVRLAMADPREFTLTIPMEAFNCHRVRFQDAPDVCSLKLQRELAASANHPSLSHFRLSDAELDDYRTAHTSKSSKSHFSPKPKQDYE